MALFEFTNPDGSTFKKDLTLAKATAIADEKNLRFVMLHGGTSGHGIPGEDF
jgi:hypothetical protein